MESPKKSKLSSSNIHLNDLKNDFFYHIGLDTKNFNLKNMFGDVKFVIMGGSVKRLKNLAIYMKNLFKTTLNENYEFLEFSKKADRYTLYKIGPVLTASHGIGSASLSVVLNELFKLIDYSGCKNVTFLRVGTCGLIGHKEGTIVLTNKTFNNRLKSCFKRIYIGKKVTISTVFKPDSVEQIKKIADEEIKNINVVLGGTLTTDDFYEEQGRLNGSFCRFTKEDRAEFLNKLNSLGIVNIEMEANTFAAYCIEANINFAIICLGLVNRLENDEINLTNQQLSLFIENLFSLVGKFIIKSLQN